MTDAPGTSCPVTGVHATSQYFQFHCICSALLVSEMLSGLSQMDLVRGPLQSTMMRMGTSVSYLKYVLLFRTEHVSFLRPK
jgi:hypothetical protein